jgi:hypothetical protein
MATQIRRVNGPMRLSDGRHRILLSDSPDDAWSRRFTKAIHESPAARGLQIEAPDRISMSLTFQSSGDIRADVILIDQLLVAADS